MYNNINFGSEKEEEMKNLWDKRFPKMKLPDFLSMLSHGFSIETIGVSKLMDSIKVEIAGDKIIRSFGFYTGKEPEEVYLFLIGILEEARGKNHFTQLFSNFVTSLKKIGVEKIELHAIDTSLYAYVKVGFQSDFPTHLKAHILKNYNLLKDAGLIDLKEHKKEKVDELFKNATSSDNPFSLAGLDLNTTVKGDYDEIMKALKIDYENIKREDFEKNIVRDGQEILLTKLVYLNSIVGSGGFFDLKSPEVEKMMNIYFDSKQIKKVPELEK